MAQEYATGAVHIFVKLGANAGGGGGGVVEYLGTAEQAPQRQTDRTFKQVMNDLSSQKPLDYVYAGGEEAVLSFVLTRWNEPIATALEAGPFSGGIGFATIFDQGSLMGQEDLALEVWYWYTFGGLAARASMVGQEAGRHYVQALFWGPETDQVGSVERKKHMVFKAWKRFEPNATPMKFVLFDFDMTALSLAMID
jgi:hypothetical protein